MRNDPDRGVTKIYNPQLISKNLSAAKPPWYGPDAHVYFINFTAFHYPMPEYFSIVRDPFEHRVSAYYYIAREEYLKYRNITFDQCMQRNLPLCRDKYINHSKFNILTYFCGFDKYCFENSKRTLAMAIQNVERHFGVVGIMEDQDAFFELLEETYPTYFHRIMNHHIMNPKPNFTYLREALNENSTKFIMSHRL